MEVTVPMTIQLTPQAEALVQQMVETGGYRDSAAVVDEALQVLKDQHRTIRLKAAIASGDAQYTRGELIPFTPELIEQMKRDAEQMAREGKEPNPDVCP